jgi:hypothetical protein
MLYDIDIRHAKKIEKGFILDSFKKVAANGRQEYSGTAVILSFYCLIDSPFTCKRLRKALG